jgi:hypothetical protein
MKTYYRVFWRVCERENWIFYGICLGESKWQVIDDIHNRKGVERINILVKKSQAKNHKAE